MCIFEHFPKFEFNFTRLPTLGCISRTKDNEEPNKYTGQIIANLIQNYQVKCTKKKWKACTLEKIIRDVPLSG